VITLLFLINLTKKNLILFAIDDNAIY